MSEEILKYIKDEEQAKQLDLYFQDLLHLESIKNDKSLRPFQKEAIRNRYKNQIIEKYSSLLGINLSKEIEYHIRLLNNEEKARDRGIVNYLDFLENTKVESSWIVQGLIPVDLLLIVANAKTGKSDLVANLCYCLITGEDFLGFPVKKNLKVGIAQLEEADHSIISKAKFHGFYTNKGKQALKDNPILMFRYIDLFNETQEVINIVEENKLDLLIIDTAITAMSPSGISVNQVEFSLPFRRLQSELCVKLGCGLIVLHHTNKTGKMMGTNALPSIGGGNWIISPDEEESANKRIIQIRSRETGEQKLTITRYYKDNLTVGYKIIAQEEDNDLKPLRDRLVGYILNCSKAKIPDIMVELDLEDEDLCRKVVIDAVNHQLIDFEYDENDEVILFISNNTKQLFENNEFYKEYKNKLEIINEIVNGINNVEANEFDNFIDNIKEKYPNIKSLWKSIYDSLGSKLQVKLCLKLYPHELHEKEINDDCFVLCTYLELNYQNKPSNHKFTIYNNEYKVIEENINEVRVRELLEQNNTSDRIENKELDTEEIEF